MPTLGQTDPTNPYSMFKGEPGTRKSTCALSYPRPQYWFSWDRKMAGILLPAKKWGIPVAEIEYDDYDNWDKALKKLEGLQVNNKYKTIVIDSITSSADTMIRQTMKSGNRRKIGGIPVTEIDDFNAESSGLTELIAITKDINAYHHCLVILIAHVIQAEYKQLGGKTHMSRSIVTAGKRIAPKIPAYCTEVYHFNIDSGLVEGSGGDYTLLTSHTGDDFARTALPLEAKIKFNDQPLYEKWIEPAIQKMKQTT